jgi:hypothetical protein
MAVSSSWVILPNPRGIHNAGCSYESWSNRTIVVRLLYVVLRLIRWIGIIRNQFSINSININY